MSAPFSRIDAPRGRFDAAGIARPGSAEVPPDPRSALRNRLQTPREPRPRSFDQALNFSLDLPSPLP
ncbi:hypothetical protein BV509_03415 [Rhodovulum sulfidophilum]|nr:hypothetical protein BV509_03415 [Rhodovulum sulfidophilum]